MSDYPCKVGKYRLKCKYHSCGRVVYADVKSMPCSACGHGTLKYHEPKANCCICGSIIWDNADSKRKVTCGRCTSRMVESLDIVGIPPDGVSNSEDLKRFREDHGWTQALLAAKLGVSRRFVVEMEGGRKSLDTKTLEFMAHYPATPLRGGKKGYTQVVDSKHSLDTENGGLA